jgi:MFS family permease
VPAIYLLFGSLTTPSFGKLGDAYGKKKLLVIALIAYTIAVIALVLSLIGIVTAYALKRAPDIELSENGDLQAPAD